MCYYIVNKNNTDWCKAPEQERKMRTLYRLVYKNGDHGAWDDDIDRIREYAKFFHAEIEIKRYSMSKEQDIPWNSKSDGR